MAAEEPDFARMHELVASTKEASMESAENYRQAADSLERFVNRLVSVSEVDDTKRLNSLGAQLVSSAKAGIERLTTDVETVAAVVAGVVHYQPEQAGVLLGQADMLEALAARARLIAVVMQTSQEVDRRLKASGATGEEA